MKCTPKVGQIKFKFRGVFFISKQYYSARAIASSKSFVPTQISFL